MSDGPTGKRVPILVGNRFGTVDETDLSRLPKGTRVLTKKEADDYEEEQAREAAEARDQARYDKLPLGVKIAGALQDAIGTLAPGGGGLAIGSAHGSLPIAKSYGEGVTQGATVGLGHGVARQAIDATMGQDAGARYAQQVEDSRLAHPLAHGAGELVGTAAGLVAPIGNAAEHVAASGLARAGVEGTSALGRAGIAAAKLGVRGAAEGAAISGGEYAGEQLLQDHDLAADKLFAATGTGALYGGATGAILGGGGSLLSSGAGAARRGMASVLARPAQLGAEAAGAVEGAATGLEAGAQAAARDVEAGAKSGIKSFVSDLTTEAGTKNRAYDRAWSAIGSGFGLQSSDYVQSAKRFLKNGTRDVGEVLMRKGILDPQWTTTEAVTKGTAAAMLPRIDSELESVGRRIGEMTDASGGMISRDAIVNAFQEVGAKYNEAAATRPIARELARFGEELSDSLGTNNLVKTHVAVQDLVRERRALDHMVWENAALNTTNVGTQVKRELRSKLEGLIVQALDESSGRMSGELATEYKALKNDYIALNIAHDVATDSAARAAKASFLGLGSLVAGGGSLVKSLAHKVVKEHGDAVAATMLYQAAEKGTIIRWLNRTDNQIARASKGLLTAPEKGAAKASEAMPPPRGIVTTALARVAAFQSDPDSFVDHATQQTEAMATHSPEIASALVAKQVQAMTFLSSKVPYQGEPDPLDPHKPAEMTPSEQASFARYAWYTERPDRFFAEVARGKLTPEGAETAQALMPRAFEQLQAQTFDALTTQLARGNRLPFRQRELLGQLLDFAATPAQRPEHRTFLQQNVADVLPSDQPPLSAAPANKRRATPTPSGSDALDRLEAKGPGRR